MLTRILLNWFKKAYQERAKGKPDLGKSCIRFKKIEQIPFEFIGELASKMAPQQWITVYEGNIKK